MPAHFRLILACVSTLVLFLFVFSSYGQKNVIKGAVIDTAEKKMLSLSIVALVNKADTLLYRSIRTDGTGQFEMTKIAPGNYTLLIMYPKMADFFKDILVTDTSVIDLGKVAMTTEAKLLEEVVVRAGVPIRMRGDTLEYNADSFAVKFGATVEDLLKRLPGIVVQKNGKIIAQVKEVKKVLVDGDEFFSDDPGLVLKYLQAGSVDKVQVYDGKSEQATLTGLDDGTREKTINLKLKKNKKNGYFGKLSAGASEANKYYQHDAMGALFNEGLKVSVFGTAARTGRQENDRNDMDRYVARDYETINDGTGNMTTSYTSGNDDAESYYGGGLPEILYSGAHLSNKWNKGRNKVFGNYRARRVDAEGWSNSKSTTVLPDGTGFFNAGESTNRSYHLGQKASGSLTLFLDSFSLVKISLNGLRTDRNNENLASSYSDNEKGFRVSSSEQRSRELSDSRNMGSNLYYLQRFRKEGRTVSLTFQQDYWKVIKDQYVFTLNNYYDPASGAFTKADTLDQLQRTNSPYESYALKAMYTDKVSKKLGYSAQYGWKTVRSANIFNTFNRWNGKYDHRIDSLSNDYDFTANTQLAEASLNWREKIVAWSIGGNLYHTQIDQFNNDTKWATSRRFVNWSPRARLDLTLPGYRYFSLNYSGETWQPGIEQLQPLRRTSNRLFIQEGNAELRPAFRHSGGVSYSSYNMTSQRNFFAYASFWYTDNEIVNQQTTDAQNATVSKYVNLDGFLNFNGRASYYWRIKQWNLRPSATINGGRTGNNSIQNGQLVKNISLYGSGELGLEHEWKDVMTTSYSFSGTYNIGRSNISTNKTNRSFYHTHTITNDVTLPLKFGIMSQCEFNFQPRNSVFKNSMTIIRWNASVEKRFFKSEAFKLSFTANDILNNNTGYSRDVSGNNTSESNSFVLKRYFMLMATWNFTKKM